jgi:hypothetical protein
MILKGDLNDDSVSSVVPGAPGGEDDESFADE